MRCARAREALGAARYEPAGVDGAVRTHLESCAACRAHLDEARRLDGVLAADADEPASLGFDTRFFARLAEEKQAHEMSWTRRWVLGLTGAGAVAAAGLAVAVVTRRTGDDATVGDASLDPRDLELAMDLELVEELALLRQIEEIEAYETLAELRLEELEEAAETEKL